MDLARMTWGSMGSFCGLEYLSHLAQGFNPLSKKKKKKKKKKNFKKKNYQQFG